MKKRVQIEIKGRVQGVGFRPTVYRYATELGLSGLVRNSSCGVTIELEGEADRIAAFVDRVQQNPPRQALIEALEAEEVPAVGSVRFEVLPSVRCGDAATHPPPDLATCEECRAEIFDPGNRRSGYAFTNCTNCGPRFTIVSKLPYDRERTSMASFRMCRLCHEEYVSASDRRFEAQPNACPECGPVLRLVDAQRRELPGDPIEETARLLRGGAIIAVKGLGGFHLCCSATNDEAVENLRRRKSRPAKPLAVMFASLAEVRRYCRVNESEEAELLSPAEPIIILPILKESGLSRWISPDTPDVGAFLPYTPLHHLLLSKISPLVMTSGNRSEEPIASSVDELRGILGPISDFALDHNRPILRRCDDSVLRVVRGRRLFLRRSRGFVPNAIALPLGGPPVLACGADLKSTFCVTRVDRAFLSQHVGDLADYATHRFYGEAIEDWLRFLEVRPEIVAHDLHPDYLSTRYALALSGVAHVAVQHHHAHVAACMAEHGLDEPVIGVALDGTGYGTDGTVWGGEFLVADLRGFRRVAHFRQYPMPGGEEAIRRPARMALSCLVTDLPADSEALDLLATAVPRPERRILLSMLGSGRHCPRTSSAGRLFDAVAALVGFDAPISYEAQAAVRLQSLSAPGVTDAYPYDLESRSEPAVLSFKRMISEVVKDIRAGRERSVVAARFHNTVAAGVVSTCDWIRGEEKLNKVALSGGVFQNHLLLELVEEGLRRSGFEVYAHALAAPSDEGIALGQAAVALARSTSNARRRRSAANSPLGSEA